MRVYVPVRKFLILILATTCFSTAYATDLNHRNAPADDPDAPLVTTPVDLRIGHQPEDLPKTNPDFVDDELRVNHAPPDEVRDRLQQYQQQNPPPQVVPRYIEPKNEGEGACVGDCQPSPLPIPQGIADLTNKLSPYNKTNHIRDLANADADLTKLCPDDEPARKACAAKHADPSCYKATDSQVNGCKTRCGETYKNDPEQAAGCQAECRNTCNEVAWASGLSVNNNCDNFFVKDGHLGKYSKMAVKAISDNIKRHQDNNSTSGFMDEITKDPILNLVCPRFNALNVDQKVLFFTYVFETIAFPESRCEPPAENWAALSPPACGLYQLEGRDSLRCPMRGAHSACCQNVNEAKLCDKTDAGAETNTGCAVSIMDDLISRPSRGAKGLHVLFGQPASGYGSYWQGLEPLPKGTHSINSQLRKNLCWFPACHDPGQIDHDCDPNNLRQKGIISAK